MQRYSTLSVTAQRLKSAFGQCRATVFWLFVAELPYINNSASVEFFSLPSIG